MKRRFKKIGAWMLVASMFLNAAVPAAPLLAASLQPASGKVTEAVTEAEKDTGMETSKESVKNTEKKAAPETETQPQAEAPEETESPKESGTSKEPVPVAETESTGATAGSPETETASDKETKKETQKETQKETAKPTETETSKKPKTTKEVTKPAETESGPDTDPQKEAQNIEFTVNGDCVGSISFGVGSMEEIADATTKNLATGTKLNLKKLKDHKAWIYLQATGTASFANLELPEGVTSKVLRGLDGLGSFKSIELDFSEYQEQTGTIVVNFNQRVVTRTARALTTDEKKLFTKGASKEITGKDLTWVGGMPAMYQPRPETGNSGVWGNGTWTMPLSVEDICKAFGVTKPKKLVATPVGRQGGDVNKGIFMRCSGVSVNGQDNPGNKKYYIKCIEADVNNAGTKATYTFRIWGPYNSQYGQSVEGYAQLSITDEEAGATKVRFIKTINNDQPISDLLGNKRNIPKDGVDFKVFKLKSGIVNDTALQNKVKKATENDNFAGNTSKKRRGLDLPKIAKLFDSKSAIPSVTNKNPNSDYFNPVDLFTTDSNGLTDVMEVKAGEWDYYVVFELRTNFEMNMGWKGSKDVPAGKHFFYKCFAAYKDEDDNNKLKVMVYDPNGSGSVGNAPPRDNNNGYKVIIDNEGLTGTGLFIKKVSDAKVLADFGLNYSSFRFEISDTSTFVKKKTLTPDATTGNMKIRDLFYNTPYYVREDAASPACKSDAGYVASTQVYSFIMQQDANGNDIMVVSENGGKYYDISDKNHVNKMKVVKEIKVLNPTSLSSVTLLKKSANPALTENNKCYSLKGAKFVLYRQAGAAPAPATDKTYGELITDEAGKSNQMDGLTPGNYYVMETEAPPGFEKLDAPYKFVLNKSHTKEKPRILIIEDKPSADPVEIFLRKKDAKTDTYLEGAEYTIQYYDVILDKLEASQLVGKTPLKTWVYRTNANGAIDMNKDNPISGDAMYTDDKGKIVFLRGTISVQETKAPDGYIVDPTVYVYKIDQEKNGAVLEAWNAVEKTNEQGRGNFKFTKVNTGREIMPGVKFEIKSKDTNEAHVIVSDGDGVVNTRKPHSVNTNRGEEPIDGVWFGDMAALDNNLGALPYGTYLVTELRCEANKNYILIPPFEVEIKENGKVEELGEKINEPTEPKLRTTAKDTKTLIHEAYADEKTVITDVVEYTNLIVGESYQFVGTLMDKATGEPLKDKDGKIITAEKTILAGENNQGNPAEGPDKVTSDYTAPFEEPDDQRLCNGAVRLNFAVDTTALKGKDIVVFEKLYIDGKYLIASHENLGDKGQTVTVLEPKVKTTATNKNDGKKYAKTAKSVTIIDEVSYEGLAVNQKYKIKGILMNRATGEPILAGGKPVAAEKEFTPSETSGTLEMEFTFDATGLGDVTTVVFESILLGGKEVAAHKDLEDEKQQVYLTDAEFKTKATDLESGNKIGHPSKTSIVKDTILYKGLIVGKEYEVTGILMDKALNKPLMVNGKEVTATTKFTASKSDGTIDVLFEVDTSALVNKRIVCFEYMKTLGREVGVHADINDEDQTVLYGEPSIRTKAVAKDTGKKQTFARENTVIVDTVVYKNLVPGTEYTIKGVLMDKATKKAIRKNGQKVTAELKFTPENDQGEIDVTYKLNAKQLAGKEAVVYEYLWLKGRQVAAHADINDKKQTVAFPEVELKTKAKGEDGRKEIPKKEKVVVVDTITYTGLIPGETYIAKGTLMDKATGKPLKSNGEAVTAQTKFTAGKANGEVDVKFTFGSGSLSENTSLVAFEELTWKGEVIGTHTDLTDEDQTVVVKKEITSEIPKPPSIPKTGDTTDVMPYLILLVSAMGTILFLQKKRKTGRK